MGNKNLRSGHRFALHETAAVGQKVDVVYTKTFYPYADTSIRFFGNPDAEDYSPDAINASATWRGSQFADIMDVRDAVGEPAYSPPYPGVTNYWPLPGGEGAGESIGSSFGQTVEGLEEFLDSTQGIYKPNVADVRSNRVEDQGWLSLEIQNNDIKKPSDIFERYSYGQSPTRSILMFDIPEEILQDDGTQNTFIENAKLKVTVFRQSKWPTVSGGVIGECFLVDHRTTGGATWISPNGSGLEWGNSPQGAGGVATPILPNPINPNLPYHGIRGAGGIHLDDFGAQIIGGGGSVQKVSDREVYALPEDGVSFPVFDYAALTEDDDWGPVELEIDVRPLINWLLPKVSDPDYIFAPDSFKFILRIGFWPCFDDVNPIPHPGTSEAAFSPAPSGGGQFSPIIGENHPKKGGKIDTGSNPKTGGEAAGALPPSNPVNLSVENPTAHKPIKYGIGQHAHDTRYSQMTRDYGDLKRQSVISTAILDMDGAIGGFIDSFTADHSAYTREKLRFLEPDAHAAAPFAVLKSEEGPGPVDKGGGGEHFMGGFSQNPKGHDHPHPHEHVVIHSTLNSPLPHSTLNSPLPHSTLGSPLPHDHEHPHPEHPPRNSPEPTWPGGWCDSKYYGEHSSGFGFDFSNNCLYSTYMFSREYHDAGNHPVANFGSTLMPLDAVQFSTSGVGTNSGVIFPEVYYDDLSTHHGMNIKNDRSLKFLHQIDAPFGNAYRDVWSVPQAWIILPPTIGGDFKMKLCYIDSEDYRITRAMNLVPNNDDINEGATIQLTDSFIVQNALGEQVDLDTINTFSLDSSNIVLAFDANTIPQLYANWPINETDNRKFVTITFAAESSPLRSGNSQPYWIPICNWRGSVVDGVLQSPHPNWEQDPQFISHTLNPLNMSDDAYSDTTIKIEPDNVWDSLGYDDEWKIITANNMVGTDGTLYDDTTQHLRLKVTNSDANAPMNSGDNIIVTPLQNGVIPTWSLDPALAFNIGDTVAIDYGRENNQTGLPQYGYVDGQTNATTNNQGLYTIVWYSISGEGARVIEVVDGEVNVNETRLRIPNTSLEAGTRIRRVNHLPKLEVSWRSDKVPDYTNYKPGILNF